LRIKPLKRNKGRLEIFVGVAILWVKCYLEVPGFEPVTLQITTSKVTASHSDYIFEWIFSSINSMTISMSTPFSRSTTLTWYYPLIVPILPTYSLQILITTFLYFPIGDMDTNLDLQFWLAELTDCQNHWSVFNLYKPTSFSNKQ